MKNLSILAASTKSILASSMSRIATSATYVSLDEMDESKVKVVSGNGV